MRVASCFIWGSMRIANWETDLRYLCETDLKRYRGRTILYIYINIQYIFILYIIYVYIYIHIIYVYIYTILYIYIIW